MQDASAVTTKKLYYEDAYATEFEAEVLSSENGDLVLDQTLFFPEEGGQSPDKGTIDGIEVADVQIRDGSIHHILNLTDDQRKAAGDQRKTAAFLPGQKVHGAIDWEHRFSNMQQHSGEHLFSGVVHTRYGYNNVGFHLSDREVTLDFDGVIPERDIPEIERQVNEAIWENISSRIQILGPEERQDLEYRSKLDLPGEVRIVTFPGIDSCACCAPHVRRTGEIGIVKVMSVIHWKSGVRVSILCGRRALAAFAKEHEILRTTANFLTTSEEEVSGQVRRMKSEVRRLESELQAKNRIILDTEIDLIPPEREDVVLFAVDIDLKSARGAVTALTEHHPGYCALFLENENVKNGYSYVIGSRTKDCRILQDALAARFEARGGGKPGMIQGSLMCRKREELRTLVETQS